MQDMRIKNCLNKLEFTTKNQLTTAEITLTHTSHTHIYTSACCIYICIGYRRCSQREKKKRGGRRKKKRKKKAMHKIKIGLQSVHLTTHKKYISLNVYSDCSELVPWPSVACGGLVCCKRLCSISRCSTLHRHYWWLNSSRDHVPSATDELFRE